MQALEKFTDKKGDEALEAAAEKMVDNLSSLKFETPPGSPSREDMPVIDDPQPAIQALTGGEVDVNPPYQVDDKSEEEAAAKTEGSWKKGDVLLERWNRLAGLE